MRDFGGPKPANSTTIVPVQPSKAIIDAVTKLHPRSRNYTIMKMARRIQYREDREKYLQETKHVKPSATTSDTGQASATPDQDDEQVLVAELRPKPSPVFRHLLKYNRVQVQVIEAL